MCVCVFHAQNSMCVNVKGQPQVSSFLSALFEVGFLFLQLMPGCLAYKLPDLLSSPSLTSL